MSKDIIILVPNGRRMKVHCTPDTSFLQVLEDVCEKHGYQPNEYNLKHHNIIVDLTSTIRFCNIPNKAILEMVEAVRKRVESNVTVGLLLDDGERRTAEFSPHTSLYDLIISLAANELPTMKNPTIMYMRQEVIGILALKEKSLRQLGLITGRAILRLMDKTETEQANVSAVYRAKPKEELIEIKETKLAKSEKSNPDINEINSLQSTPDDDDIKKSVQKQDDTKKFDPIKLIKNEINKEQQKTEPTTSFNIKTNIDSDTDSKASDQPMTSKHFEQKNANPLEAQETLERRLRIEEEVNFLGSQKAIAFMQPEEDEDELSDLPDDFYELSIEEVRKIYHDLQQKCMEYEETPLLTSNKRDQLEKEVSQQKLNTYKNVVVRIQFPDNMILQGVFSPMDTVENINNFVKEHIHDPNQPFQIFTTPLKETLDPKTTLLDAKFVPCVHMHFRWLEHSNSNGYLKDEIYLKQTSSDAASILASKYRAPTRRKLEETQGNSKNAQSRSSTSKESKLPKWFKK
ncbi:tether containing UBX domain for GLUT4 [Pieris napi]|uniref:tether containing UBX domain for GLUT4 n=1 Tax=Pieris napi TaxID=78633 RepID=UPI001FBAAF0A|nr:tether containing UBX domain for GLUT4 [Pieris napi]